jgi:hypothetical protein
MEAASFFFPQEEKDTADSRKKLLIAMLRSQ